MVRKSIRLAEASRETTNMTSVKDKEVVNGTVPNSKTWAIFNPIMLLRENDVYDYPIEFNKLSSTSSTNNNLTEYEDQQISSYVNRLKPTTQGKMDCHTAMTLTEV